MPSSSCPPNPSSKSKPPRQPTMTTIPLPLPLLPPAPSPLPKRENAKPARTKPNKPLHVLIISPLRQLASPKKTDQYTQRTQAPGDAQMGARKKRFSNLSILIFRVDNLVIIYHVLFIPDVRFTCRPSSVVLRPWLAGQRGREGRG